MKRILFISPINLKDARRGTPIRIVNLLKQINKHHILKICTIDIPEEMKTDFIPYPKRNGFLRIIFFVKIIKKERINLVLTACETSLKQTILLKLLTGVKIAVDIHGLLSEELYLSKKIGFLKKRLLQFRLSIMFRFYNHLFVVSEKLKKFYMPINNNITVVHGGVNITMRQITCKKQSADMLTIGYMGNFRSYQGLDDLFQAVAHIKQNKIFPFHLRLVVSNRDEAMLSRLSELNLLPHADIYVDIPHNQTHKIISGADVLIIPRPSIPVTEYAFPTKLPEYLATGIPIITSDVGPTSELFSDTNACMLYNPKSAQGLVDVLCEFYRLNTEERCAIGNAGYHFAVQNLTWESIGKRINLIIDTI